MDEKELGGRIRAERLSRGLTLADIGAKTGFTRGYISKVENGKVSLPIATLFKISAALGVDAGSFFRSVTPDERVSLVKSDERQLVARQGNLYGYRYESVAFRRRHKKMEPFLVYFPPRLKAGVMFEHEGEEMVFLLKGRVRFVCGDKQFLLKPGDCLYFDSTIPHRGESVGPVQALGLIVVSS